MPLHAAPQPAHLLGGHRGGLQFRVAACPCRWTFLHFQVHLNISVRSGVEIEYHRDGEVEPGLEITKRHFLV